jgi:hypothetical protein
MNKRTPSLKRQLFMRRLVGYSMLTLVVLLGVYISSRLQLGQQRYLLLTPEQYPPGTIQSITLKLSKGGHVYLINNAGSFYTIIALDSYDGCSVSWIKGEQLFVSPCSKSRYSVDGRWVSGPSHRDLDRLATHIRNGNLLIDTETRVIGKTRSADEAQDNKKAPQVSKTTQ